MGGKKIHPARDLTDELILSWDSEELILNVYHLLRQYTVSLVSYSQLLAEGGYGFVSNEQKDALEKVLGDAKRIETLNQWLKIYIRAKRESDEIDTSDQ